LIDLIGNNGKFTSKDKSDRGQGQQPLQANRSFRGLSQKQSEEIAGIQRISQGDVQAEMSDGSQEEKSSRNPS
jgi:hypothetical protein